MEPVLTDNSRMRRRVLIPSLVIVATCVGMTGLAAPAEVAAVATPVDQVVLDGGGNGHGVGLSQWGAYGYAVDHGWTATQILDHYYGGTESSAVPLDTKVRVRLTNLDNAQTALSVETGELVVEGFPGGPWKSVLIREGLTNGVYSVWARAEQVRCPAAGGDPLVDGWTLVTDSAAGKVEVRTLADSSTVPDYHQMVAACEPSRTVRWYRGTIRALNDQSGANRTVNEVPLEQYLRTVIAMEMSPGWASAGGGKGAQALQAQAVAARSYALAYRWYSYAEVCDMTCQSYFGAAFQTATGKVRVVEAAATDAAVLATAGVVRRVIGSGAIALTMFSASNGGFTSPGTSAIMPFPAVADEGDDTSLNPSYRWTVTLTAAGLTAKYPSIGSLTGVTVLARNGFGEWGGRATSVRVEGTAASVTVTGAQFRTAMGLRDTLFSVRPTSPTEPPPPPPVVDACDGRNEPTVSGAMPTVQATRFTPLAPVRLIDTRKGVGTAAVRLKGGCTLQVDPGLDASVASVAVNLTSVRAAANGYVVAYPCGVDRPVAAAVQSVANRVVAGMAVVPLGADGTFCVYSHTSTDMVIDLFGSYSAVAGSRFEPVTPTRLFDSRSSATPVSEGTVLRVKVAGKAGAPSTASAVSLTIHALAAARDGYLTAFPCGTPMPGVASVAVNAGGSVTNHVETAIAGGDVCVFVSAPMQVIVDMGGWYGPTATTEYYAITPVRAVDTRSNVGLTGGFTAKVDRAVQLAGTNGLPPAARLRAVVAQVIAVGAAAPGYLTVHPCLAVAPSVSMVRYAVGSNSATSVAAPDDARGRWCVTASSSVHLVVDLSGYFA